MTIAPANPHPRSSDLASEARAVIAARPVRIQRFEVAGRDYWVKRKERLSMRMRLQKGDPRRAFAAERAALRTLHDLGASVPPVLAEGADFFVMPDSGMPLRDMLRRPGIDPAERLRAFEAAARGLARFHAMGVSHGRPAIKDICWDGETATFLDFERYATRRNTHAGHVQDLVILLFSTFSETGRPCPETEALIATYRAADPAEIWAGAVELCRRLRWLGPLSWPVRKLRNAPEFHAIPLTLVAFGAS
jgi:tRNA A-37 threonylcarbamoyl transferase component Bud32